MKFWGISANNHDAAISVVEDGEILFAGHSERYSRIKNDSELNDGLIKDALNYGGNPDVVIYYEKPWLRKLRNFLYGDWTESTKKIRTTVFDKPYKTVSHHHSHAANGYFTSKFTSASILVADSAGEFETFSIWAGEKGKLKKVRSCRYPRSLGLFYSAFTERCGLKPNEEEYIMMDLAPLGNKNIHLRDIKELMLSNLRTGKPNFHNGCKWYKPENDDVENIAATVQYLFNTFMIAECRWIEKNLPSKNLVLSGGCALNCITNTEIAEKTNFRNIWIPSNPGDAGSSLGAIAAYTGEHLFWRHPYLGYEIKGKYPVESALALLLKGELVGIANGRAEFGPRALGNRSLFMDPRLLKAKDIITSYKNREKFKPFAPVILEEYADEYFEMPVLQTPYMKFSVKCKQPEKFPAIVHIDETSRIQTVNDVQNPGLYNLLKKFHRKTNCPMLLNTSLNLAGEPLVNTESDAKNFEERSGIKVLLSD